MGRISHHLKGKDYKKTHQRCLDEQRVLYLERRERQILELEEILINKELSAPYKSDWRKDINEGMTTSGVTQATIPAEGDTELSSIPTSISNDVFQDSVFVSGADIDSSGNGSGYNGGFNIGQNHVVMTGTSNYSNQFGTAAVDLTSRDTLSVTSIAGNNSNGGVSPSNPLYVLFYDANNSSSYYVANPKTYTSSTSVDIPIPKEWQKPGVKLFFYTQTSVSGGQIRGLQFNDKTISLSGLNHATLANLFPDSGTTAASFMAYYTGIKNPTQDQYRSMGFFYWYNANAQRYGVLDNIGTDENPEIVYRTWPAAPVSGATTENEVTTADYIYIGQQVYNQFVGSNLYGISNIAFKRKAPMNVFVPLDSPEATNFIRTDPIMKGLSAQERRKKLEEMLDSGDEYLLKQVGLQGSKARPADTGDIQSWEQAAGDEVAQLSPSDYNRERQIDQMLLKGLQRGDYGTGPDIDRQIQNIMKNMQRGTPGGLPQAQSNQDTQIAVSYPQDPKWMRDIQKEYDKVKDKPFKPGTPKPGRGMGDTWEGPVKGASTKNKNKVQIAHYEPQGQVISEKKLKSPKQVLKDKIPGYYDGKPAPLGFPDNPPPEMVNGMHPDLVDGKNVANRFNRLDPQSAQAMPLTGNPHIDKKVLKARKQPK
jgi:hypothetical protein